MRLKVLALFYFGKVGLLSGGKEEEIKSKHHTGKTSNNMPGVEGDSFEEPPVFIWGLVHLK